MTWPTKKLGEVAVGQILERRKEIEQVPCPHTNALVGGSPWRNFSGREIIRTL